ncbi:glycine dehydrogenase [unidentified eubacterium SCB49]|nr:glycine dehydrogenase [unidentified eubacterium SCB49]
MKLLKKLFIDCETSALYCDKAQYNEATSMEKFQLKLHIVICKICRSHSIKNTKLTKACNKANLAKMPETDKAALKSKLEKEIGN